MDKKKLYVHNQKALANEFYKSYSPDYFLYKLALLKNSHDNYESIKSLITKDLNEVNDDDYLRVIRTELHFFIFK